ncbi:unnamed protein product, partial [marine sediment metagenome]
MIARQGTRTVAEIKQNKIPMTHPIPKVTIGGILDTISEPKPIIVVMVESNTAFPVS